MLLNKTQTYLMNKYLLYSVALFNDKFCNIFYFFYFYFFPPRLLTSKDSNVWMDVG